MSGAGPRAAPLSAQAFSQLRRLIITGELEPGDKMNVRVLGERLGLSATPVKAALSALEREGFVTSQPNRGHFVTTLGTRDVRELFEIREAMEPAAARLAVARTVEASAMSELRSLVAGQRDAAEAGDLASYNELNLQFHRMLWRLADNSRLTRLMDNVMGQMTLATTFTSRAPGRLRQAINEHEEMLDLCETADVARLEEVTARHVRESHAAYLQMVDVGG